MCDDDFQNDNYFFQMPDGKPPNEFAFDAKPKNKDFALDIIKSLNDQWKALMSGEGSDGVSRTCTQTECSEKVSAEDAKAALEAAAPAGEAGELADAVDKWHHVKL